MKIAISTTAQGMDSPIDPRFGRAAGFMIIDTETGAAQYQDNTANTQLAHGAGIQAAQRVASAGVDAVVTGRVGPKAWQALEAGRVTIYLGARETVARTLEAFRNNELEPAATPA